MNHRYFTISTFWISFDLSLRNAEQGGTDLRSRSLKIENSEAEGYQCHEWSSHIGWHEAVVWFDALL